MIEMVSNKGNNFRFSYYCKRKKQNKKPRLYYAKLTISTVIHKIFIRTENTTTSTHYMNTYHILKISYMHVQDTRR